MKETDDRVLNLCKTSKYFSCPATSTPIEIASAESESAKEVSDKMIFSEYKPQKDPVAPELQNDVITSSSNVEPYSKSEVRKKVYRVTKKDA
jgi:hypothetical protein